MLVAIFERIGSHLRSKTVNMAVLLCLLVSCGIAERPDPAASNVPFAAPGTIAARETYVAIFGVLVAPAAGRTLPRYVTASITPMVGRWDNYTSAGTGSAYPFEVRVRPSYRNSWTVTEIAASDPARVVRLESGTASRSDVMDFAQRVARSTFCKGGVVAENRSAGRVFRDPADIAAIAGASAAAPEQRDTVPNSARGQALQPIERLERDGWLVRLRCSLWRAP